MHVYLCILLVIVDKHLELHPRVRIIHYPMCVCGIHICTCIHMCTFIFAHIFMCITGRAHA